MVKQQFNPEVLLVGAADLGALKHQIRAKPGQAGSVLVAGGCVIGTTENTFQAIVQISTTFPILLLLWIPAGDRLFPMARVLGDAVNALNGQIQLSRIDTSSDLPIAQALQVQGTPALFALIAGHPMSLLQGLPGDDEFKQLTDEVIPRIIEAAAQSGMNGTAPHSGDPDSDAAKGAGVTGAVAGAEQVPPEYAEAHRLAEGGDYTGAAAKYERVLGSDPSDALAAHERAKALLLTRSGAADVRDARVAAAAAPDDVEAQLAVTDTDMIGGQIQGVLDRLLDFLVAGHKANIEQVCERLLEYFVIPEPADPRLIRARRRLATFMY